MRYGRVALLALVVGACRGGEPVTLAPLGQVLLYVDTDAPLPAAPGDTLAFTDPPALFDRVRIEVVRSDAEKPCADCTREFDLDRRLVGEGRASVGLRPPVGARGYVARVRLFRSAFATSGEPLPSATTDVTVELPTIAAEGVVAVTVLLKTEDVGRPVGSRERPVQPIAGAPTGGHAGTWPGAQRRDCGPAQPEPGEVCIPGGAYWMGHPKVPSRDDLGEVRLVNLSPFFLDSAEVTIGDFRASGLAKPMDPYLSPFGDPYNNDQTARQLCLYTPEPGYREQQPVNCLSWDTARAYCLSRGADLPTEAQLHYAASGLESRLYVWGDDAPSCEDAVFTRADIFVRLVKCPGGSTEPAGAGARDRLVLPWGTVFDLAGNVAEYTRDLYNSLRESCWQASIYRDPLCDESLADPHPGSPHTVTGGSWAFPPQSAAAAARGPSVESYDTAIGDKRPSNLSAIPLVATGFRCARDAK